MMDLAQATRWREIASKVAAAFCVLALLALVDGLLVHFREPANMVKVLPGERVDVNGELTDEAQGVSDLTYTSSTDRLRVVFAAIHKGYFLGGDMWRGQLIVDPQIPPGEYRLSVMPKSSKSGRKAPTFRVLVFPEATSLQKSSASLIRRYTGISPFVAAAGCVPGILLAVGVVYFLSERRERLLAREGRAEIYRMARREDGGYEIRFGLGVEQGLGPKVRVNIFDEADQVVATGMVEASGPRDSVAVVPADREIKEGFLVSRQV